MIVLHEQLFSYFRLAVATGLLLPPPRSYNLYNILYCIFVFLLEESMGWEFYIEAFRLLLVKYFCLMIFSAVVESLPKASLDVSLEP